MRSRRSVAMVGVAAAVALFGSGCGDDGDAVDTSGTETPLVSLGGTVDDRGTTDLGAGTELELELGDRFFAPTFVQAEPGATIALTLVNGGAIDHTFTADGAGIDELISAGESVQIEITLPDGDTAAFYCRFHVGGGMQGAFVTGAGDVEPADVEPADVTVAPGGGGYGY